MLCYVMFWYRYKLCSQVKPIYHQKFCHYSMVKTFKITPSCTSTPELLISNFKLMPIIHPLPTAAIPWILKLYHQFESLQLQTAYHLRTEFLLLWPESIYSIPLKYFEDEYPLIQEKWVMAFFCGLTIPLEYRNGHGDEVVKSAWRIKTLL